MKKSGDEMKDIKEHWDEMAKKGHLSTQPDFNIRELEIKLIKSYLNKEDCILDVGCGTGFSSANYSEIVKEILGIDYAKNMIEIAKEEFKNVHNCKFEVQNILDKKFCLKNKNKFNKIISTRCLINLENFDEQKFAIKNIHDMLKKKGSYLMLEGWENGRRNLNKLRKKYDLPIVEKKWFNITFEDEKLYPYLEKYFSIEDEKYFDMYYLVSRIIHPIFVKPGEPQFNHQLNEIGKKLNLDYYGKINGISLNKLIVLRKK